MKVLILGLIPVMGFTVGVLLAQRRARGVGGMSRADRIELGRRREFMAELGNKAVEHSMYGDDFAVIVAGMLEDFRKNTSGRWKG